MTASPPRLAIYTCAECGANSLKSDLCPRCGAALGTITTPASVTTAAFDIGNVPTVLTPKKAVPPPPAYAPPIAQPPAAPPAYAPPPAPRRSLPVVPLVLAAVAILIVLVLAFFLIAKPGDSSTTPSTSTPVLTPVGAPGSGGEKPATTSAVSSTQPAASGTQPTFGTGTSQAPNSRPSERPPNPNDPIMPTVGGGAAETPRRPSQVTQPPGGLLAPTTAAR